MPDQDGNVPGAPVRFAKGRALVIAIAGYAKASPLPDAVLNDGRDLESVLTSVDGCAYERDKVVLLLDGEATLARIKREFEALSKATAPDETVTIFFSGHGGRIGAGAHAKYALAPFDYDPSDKEGTLLFESEITAALKAIGADRLIVYLDACHAAGAGELKEFVEATLISGFDEKSLDRLAQGTGRVMIASCKPDEKSIVRAAARNSLFTGYLLKALRGEAPSRGDGLVRVFETFSYVSEALRKAAPGRQHPIFKAHALDEDFPIALFRGGTKSASAEPKSAAPDVWKRTENIFSDLYPTGPLEEEIWARAGGDVSKLRLGGTGGAQWFAAFRTLRQGGGGAQINRKSLIETALSEFPYHPGLSSLRSDEP